MEPELIEGRPVWWHPRGADISIKVIRSISVELSSDNVEVKIANFEGFFTVKWHISHENISFDYDNGYRILTPEEIKTAFGLKNQGTSREPFDSIYGAEAAVVGKFIRYERYLNFPGPGTGFCGDPNASILITDEIKEAISKIL